MVGRPSHGLDRVLYIRVRPDLVKKLDAVVRREKKSHLGIAVSRSDVAREILYDGIATRLNEVDHG